MNYGDYGVFFAYNLGMFVRSNEQDKGCFTYYNPEHCVKQIDVAGWQLH
ncbi:7031_t:CDS:2 [Gigaspora margarita]|uniref:7031_t:CDS:1 n=1 Tax=Gigaspora margarita TaxID=4874 RepID=A0ABN7UVL5_GIGMA|nr:7031_t:CDS:2 [Gigaspora margarita]